MNRIAPVNKATSIAAKVVSLIILLVPFHAFLTIWAASATGHYALLLRLWKEVLLAPLAVYALFLVTTDKRLRQKLLNSWLIRLISLYFLVLLIGAIVPLVTDSVSVKAVWYGLLVDSRFLVFFLVTIVIYSRLAERITDWRKLLLIPATLVAAIAVLQYLVLPYDFLKHFGYDNSTIQPYETINHNLAHIRVMSTLRGANPLGAYLVMPISALAILLFREKRQRLNKLVLAAGLLLALVFSFSRSGWIGAFLTVLAAAFFSLKRRSKKIEIYTLGVVLVIGAVSAIALRNNLTFQDAFLHTDKASTAAESSNYGHIRAFKLSIKDIAHQPLGGGVGSAGPQSVYNAKQPGRIAENYYLQIGQEMGVTGMALFIAIIVLLGRSLYARRADPLALALLAALIGLSFVNLLSHAWEDDTLAYVFWGLAGVALAPLRPAQRRSR